MITLKLSGTWDLQLDGSGQFATVTGPYAVAQSVANACRLFTSDAYLDQTEGIPHFELELGRKPSDDVIKERLVRAALAVNEVETAVMVEYKMVGRVATGTTQIKTKGETIDVAF